jgi:TadE-like protein
MKSFKEIKMIKLFKKFKTNTKAQAGIEFALLLPMMVALFFGTLEVTQGQMLAKKLDKAVRVATDLPGHATTLERATAQGDELHHYLEAAAQVISPYDPALVRFALAGVLIDRDGIGRVVWSGARGSTQPRGCGTIINVPDNLKPQNNQTGFLIYGEGFYTYTSLTGWFFRTAMEFKTEAYWPARHNQDVRSIPAQC